jgi:hypothetical protein
MKKKILKEKKLIQRGVDTNETTDKVKIGVNA